jgi:phosphoribosyl-ATP pyrophosphohydrolase
MSFLDQLYQTILQRKHADAGQSYAASLFAKGRVKIAQKLGEEAVELALASVASDKTAIVSESADLLFHLGVLWAECGVTPEEVAAELKRREGISGLEEKANRKD